MIARFLAWLAYWRRMRAAEEMDMVWTCWYLFFRKLYGKPPIGPLALAEYQFKEAVYFHKRMVK
jgi:hypothetical protein